MGIFVNTPVPTTAGWLPAGQLQAGDEIFNFEGQPVKIATVQKYTPTGCYKIWLRDGLTLVVDARTGIPVFDQKAKVRLARWTRTKNRIQNKLSPLGPESIMTWEHGRCRLPVCQPIRPRHRNLPVDPYELARWFFDRSEKRRRSRTDITRELIERYPVIPTHIPEEYLFASFEQRLAFLRGIISTRRNPFDPSNQQFQFEINDRRLMRQVQNLVESLGIKSRITRVLGGLRYRIVFKTNLRLLEDQIPVKRHHELEFRVITTIDRIPPRECIYIKTEDPNNTILVSEGYLGVAL